MASRSDRDHPRLAGFGLYASKVTADGNCLFHALSDQLYGHQDEHEALRAAVIHKMREDADHYKQFIEVHPGGGLRRNPKRKNARGNGSQVLASSPSGDEVDRAFERHLETMAQGGNYGDHMEITAFAAVYNVDVKIYQRSYEHTISGGDEDMSKKLVHIAYHEAWEHYSSIRNLDGPHFGLPNIQAKGAELTKTDSETKEFKYCLVKSELRSCTKPSIIYRTLAEVNYDVGAAIEKLRDCEKSRSTTPASSSVEREPDSDDESVHGPNKRRERHINRAKDNVAKRRLSPKSQLEKNRQRLHRFKNNERARASSSPDSAASIGSQDSEGFAVAPNAIFRQENSPDAGNDWLPVSNDDSANSDISASPSPQPLRLKLNPPKTFADQSTKKSINEFKPRQLIPQTRKSPSLGDKSNTKMVVHNATSKESPLTGKEMVPSDAVTVPIRPKGVAVRIIRPKGVAVRIV